MDPNTTDIPDMFLLGKTVLNDLQAMLDCRTQHLRIFQHTVHAKVMQDTAILPQRKVLMILQINQFVGTHLDSQDLMGTTILWTRFQTKMFGPMLVEIVENKMCVQVYNQDTVPYVFVQGEQFGYIDSRSCGVKYDVYHKLKPQMVMMMGPIFAGEIDKTQALQTHLR